MNSDRKHLYSESDISIGVYYIGYSDSDIYIGVYYIGYIVIVIS